MLYICECKAICLQTGFLKCIPSRWILRGLLEGLIPNLNLFVCKTTYDDKN